MPITPCASDCGVTIPAALVEPCKLRARQGGIKRLVYFSCDLDFAAIATEEFWSDNVSLCKIRISPELSAEMPKATANKKRTASCRPEQIISKTFTLNFMDSSDQRDLAGLYQDYPFYNSISENQSNLVFGFFDCNGMFFGPFINAVYDISSVIENSNDGDQHWDGSITWTAQEIEQPIDLSAVNPVPGENVYNYLVNNITFTC